MGFECQLNMVKIIVGDESYSFELKPDQNFYFVITEEDRVVFADET